MRKKQGTYKRKAMVAAIAMLMALAWLTVSLPFVYAAQQQQAALAKANTQELPDSEESPNPFSNASEEKAETASTTLSEYLHTIDELSQLAISLQKHNCFHCFSIYVAFYGEMLCPPPNLSVA